MKKLLAVLLALTVCLAAASAQIRVFGGGQAAYLPFSMDFPKTGDPNMITVVEPPWRAGTLGLGFTIQGQSQNVGFEIGFDLGSSAYDSADSLETVPVPAGIKLGGSAHIWVRPVDWFKLSVGKVYDETLAGKVGVSDLANYILSSFKGEGYMGSNTDGHRMDLTDGGIFTRFNPWPWGQTSEAPAFYGTDSFLGEICGILLAAAPVRGLFVGVYIDADPYSGWDGNAFSDAGGRYNLSNRRSAEDVLKETQFALGYDMLGIGHIRAQYVGYLHQFEAAFAYTGMPGLVADAGVRIPISMDAYYGDGVSNIFHRMGDYAVSAGVNFNYGDFDILGRGDVRFGGYRGRYTDVRFDNGVDIIGYVSPSYRIGVVTLGLDAGVEYLGPSKWKGKEIANSDGLDIGLGVWARQRFGNFTIKYAMTAKLPTEWPDFASDRPSGTKTEQVLRLYIPVLIRAYF
ncbi:MAG: hypothetical protein LBS97_05335 [Treponema sp.]|jgi:hypothetical protein|nr:hypothetical protein [Treponema sp.]